MADLDLLDSCLDELDEQPPAATGGDILDAALDDALDGLPAPPAAAAAADDDDDVDAGLSLPPAAPAAAAPLDMAQLQALVQQLQRQGQPQGAGADEEDDDDDEKPPPVNPEVLAMIQQLLLTEGDGVNMDEVLPELLEKICAAEGIALDLGEGEAKGSDSEEEDDDDQGMADPDHPPTPGTHRLAGGSAETAHSPSEAEREDDTATDSESEPPELEDDGRPAPPADLSLHQAAWNRDFPAMNELLAAAPAGTPGCLLEAVDANGNTPLLMAIKRGNIAVARFLVRKGANVDIKSGHDYHLLDEAVLCRDRDLVYSVYAELQRRTWEKWVAKRPQLIDALQEVPDFYLEMRWNFESSGIMTPLVRALAPSDTYRIWKRGSWLRVDSTIVGFQRNFKAQRGHTSLLFQGAGAERVGNLLLLDRVKQRVTRVLRRMDNPTPEDLEDAVTRLMHPNSQPLDSMNVNATKLSFSPVKSRTGHPKTGTIGAWQCARWEAKGDFRLIMSRKPPNGVRTMQFDTYFAPGGSALARCEPAAVEAYIAERDRVQAQAAAAHGHKPKKGKKKKAPQQKSVRKKVKAAVWMSPDFPISLPELLPALNVLAMHDKHVERLYNMLTQRSVPDGLFPVKVTIPLLLSITAVVTFERFNRDPVPEELFEVPADYVHADDPRSPSSAASSGSGGAGASSAAPAPAAVRSYRTRKS